MTGQTITALGYEWSIEPESFIAKRARYILEAKFKQWVAEEDRSDLEKEALLTFAHLYYDTLSVTKKLQHPDMGDCRALLNTWTNHPELWVAYISGYENDDEPWELWEAVRKLNPHWYPQLQEEAEGVAEAVEQAVEGKGDAMEAAKAVDKLQDKREAEAEKNG